MDVRDEQPAESPTQIHSDTEPSRKSVENFDPATKPEGSVKLRELTDKALNFLSSASNETLGACIVGLSASTYLVLGRVGLVVIGVVGGVALHATWENRAQSAGDEEGKTTESSRRRQVGLDVVQRLLEWRQKKSSPIGYGSLVESTSTSESPAHLEMGYGDFQPSTRVALAGLTDAVVRDYVKWWYVPLLPSDNSFPTASRQTLTNFLLAFSSHLSRKRPADTFIDFLTNTSSIVIVFINELSAALISPGLVNVEPALALHRYLEENSDSHLANVTDKEQQERKLGAVAEDILHHFLDSKAYSCEPVRVFFREVLAGLVLEMTVQSCSTPEFINGWIVYLLEEADTELIDAIDAGVGGATIDGASKVLTQDTEEIMPADSTRSNDVSASDLEAKSQHKRAVSSAEDAMEEAMQEAKRLTELIAAEEAKKNQETTSTNIEASSSGTTTANGPTPTSSESDLAASSQGQDDDHVLADSETTAAPSFTSFDQILPHQKNTALQADSSSNVPAVPPLTLHNASVSIFDDEQPGEKATLRSKPMIDYLLQIEPATSQYPGWMMPRRYSDFETLHEVLRRISIISGVAAFAERHAILPTWKNKTKTVLRKELEHYLRDALSFARLAESEGMKRFLEKDQGLDRSSSATKQGGFGFPSPAAFETMGKGMLDVLSSAPKGAASGGKAVVGGFTGVLGLGQKKPGNSNRPASRSISRPSSSLSHVESSDPVMRSKAARQSEDSLQNANSIHPEASRNPTLPDRPIYIPQKMENGHVVPAETANDTPVSTPPRQSTDQQPQPDFHLPPPPSDIPDDYNAFQDLSTSAKSNSSQAVQPPKPPSKAPTPAPPSQSTRPPPLPLTEPETRITIELFFAILTELYTLSSAWSIRLTLLGAAKTYLLRPGNPSLASIRSLIQDTIINAQTSDEGIAAHINKLRENVLPTEEERKTWPKHLTDEEKERLRLKARRLLVEKGVPAAVRGVVGQAATGEAMGRIFDSLQVQKVARGFVFAIMLQAVKALAQ